MRAMATWHGTPGEAEVLAQAVRRYCREPGEGQHCTFGLFGVQLTECAAHHAGRHEQRFLDGLLWARRTRAQRMKEEWTEWELPTIS